MKFSEGAPVHWWTRSKGKVRCNRAFVVTFPQDLYARVLRPDVNELEVVETKRLKAGWNLWSDHEGRPILPEGTWKDGRYYPPGSAPEPDEKGLIVIPDLKDAITLLERLIGPCDDGVGDHLWRRCRRCLMLHEIANFQQPSFRLLESALRACDRVRAEQEQP